MKKQIGADNTILVEALANPSEIGFINAIVEEYEGLAVMRTKDRHQGLVKFWVPPDLYPLFEAVMEDLIERQWLYSFEIVEPWWQPRQPSPQG